MYSRRLGGTGIAEDGQAIVEDGQAPGCIGLVAMGLHQAGVDVVVTARTRSDLESLAPGIDPALGRIIPATGNVAVTTHVSGWYPVVAL